MLTSSPGVFIFPLVNRTYPNLAAFVKDYEGTQEALAEELQISQSYLSMLMRGERQPSLPLALRIAERARIPLESLLSTEAKAS